VSAAAWLSTVELTDDERADIFECERAIGVLTEHIRKVYRRAAEHSGIAREWLDAHP
jgi:hypothetical protein